MNRFYCPSGKPFIGRFNKLSLVASCHAAIIQELTQMIFTCRDLRFAVDKAHSNFISTYKFLPGNVLTHKIKDTLPRSSCAARGMVLGRRKSLELIMRNVCSLFGGETAGQQDTAKIKAQGGKKDQAQKERQADRDVSSLQPSVHQEQSKTSGTRIEISY